DSWKREQFHQLAAFFPRLSVRPEDPGQIRTFAVSSFEDRRGSGRRGADFDVDQFFRFLDRNRDGNLSKSEARGPVEARFDQIVERFDRNKDQMLSKEEFAEARSQANTQPGQGAAEYYMPDLDNPASQGLLIEPVFFISEVKGPALSRGADDLTRRSALVDYLTSKSNPWFSRAIVNRIWGELLGRGFYMPIDDMGPERTPVHPEVLELLSEEFVTHGYDLKWLFRTILNTKAYQRSLAVDPVAEQIPFAAASPGRLRADQIYNSLNAILGTSGPVPFRGGRDAMVMQVQGLDPRKAAFSALFGVDPSTPQEDILGTVPQALFLMNTGVVENQVRATGSTRLAGLLKEFDVDEDALAELYLLVLTRSPSSRELAINLEYIKEVGSRGEAYEDIYWSLLNSTEFCSRR
ncbi:MAG: DUF1553 domain-containing protein, partial [Planctomycetaceae bacterium]|nr:DUF1553 domain-containing protein [Planctomycetaceae bacterium]